MAKQTAPKVICRPAFTYCIHHKAAADFRVLHGNKIVSRHTTVAAARVALDALYRKMQVG